MSRGRAKIRRCPWRSLRRWLPTPADRRQTAGPRTASDHLLRSARPTRSWRSVQGTPGKKRSPQTPGNPAAAWPPPIAGEQQRVTPPTTVRAAANAPACKMPRLALLSRGGSKAGRRRWQAVAELGRAVPSEHPWNRIRLDDHCRRCEPRRRVAGLQPAASSGAGTEHVAHAGWNRSGRPRGRRKFGCTVRSRSDPPGGPLLARTQQARVAEQGLVGLRRVPPDSPRLAWDHQWDMKTGAWGFTSAEGSGRIGRHRPDSHGISPAGCVSKNRAVYGRPDQREAGSGKSHGRVLAGDGTGGEPGEGPGLFWLRCWQRLAAALPARIGSRRGDRGSGHRPQVAAGASRWWELADTRRECASGSGAALRTAASGCLTG